MALGYSNGMQSALACGATGDGVTDDTTALQTALTAATTLWLQPGATYKITSPLTKAGGVTIVGNGATILTEGDFDTTGALDITVALAVDGQTVSALADVSTSGLSATIGATGTEVTRITVTDASEFSRGDVVKVYSQDQFGQSGSANDEYIGEFAVVLETDEDNEYLYLDRILYYQASYSTSPKVSALNTDQVKITDLIFTKSSSQAATANTKGIKIMNAVDPYVDNVRFIDCDDDGLTYQGCYGARSSSISGYGLKTDAANSSTGYLVFEVSCAHGHHDNIQGFGLRKVYETDTKTPSTPASDPQMWFGETYGTIVSNSAGIAFGAHAGSRNITFENCKCEITTYRAPSTAIARGFTIRGLNISMNNCFLKAATVNIYSETGATVGPSVTMRDTHIDATPVIAGDTSLRFPAIEVTGIAAARGTLKMYGGYVRGIYTQAIDLNYADVETYGTHLHYARNLASGSASDTFLMDESTVKNFNPVYDSTGHLGTATIRLFDMNDANCSFESYGGQWVSADGGDASAAEIGNLSNADGTVIVVGLRPDAALNADLANVGGGATTEVDYFSPGTNYSGSLVWDPGNLVDGAGETSGNITVTGAAFGDAVEVAAPYDMQGILAHGYVSAADTVNIRIQNETGGAIDLASGTWKVRTTRIN